MRQSGLRNVMHAGLLACLAFAAAPAMAQSAYDCRALETHSALPAVEGEGGVFFRISPDLHSYQSISDESVAHIAELSQALAARGTTLIVLPVPGRAQIMAHRLPPMAAHLGYDPDIAMAVHEDALRRLKRADIAFADPRRALRQAALAGRAPFFATDPRPTSEGSKIMAQSVAAALAQHARTKDLPRGQFVSAPAAPLTLRSSMRARLQLACQDALPEPTTQTETTQAQALLGGGSSGTVAVIGTEFTGTEALNFAGYLSQYSGLRALAYGVPGGGAFAAMSSYLTSADFRATAPQVLVWEFPIWESLANHGDQPIKELIAAAGNACTTTLPLRPGAAPNRIVADLRGLSVNHEITLALDTNGAAVPAARFHFTSADNQVRARSIYRHPDQLLTGRFFMPLSGLEATALQSVEVEIPEPFGPLPSLVACIKGVVQ